MTFSFIYPGGVVYEILNDLVIRQLRLFQYKISRSEKVDKNKSFQIKKLVNGTPRFHRYSYLILGKTVEKVVNQCR